MYFSFSPQYNQASCYVCRRIYVFSTSRCCAVLLDGYITVYNKLTAYINIEITSEATGVRERVTSLELHSSVIFMLHTVSCMIKRLQWCVNGLCYEMVNNVIGYLEREKDYLWTRCRMGEWDKDYHYWLFGLFFCLRKCSRM
jgi:hypothetical protein